jgi:hypothetical protein
LHAGDGDVFVAGIDQTDKLTGGFVDIADAMNDGESATSALKVQPLHPRMLRFFGVAVDTAGRGRLRASAPRLAMLSAPCWWPRWNTALLMLLFCILKGEMKCSA